MMGKRAMVFLLVCAVSIAHVFGAYLSTKTTRNTNFCTLTVKGVKFTKRRRETLHAKKTVLSEDFSQRDIAEIKKIRLKLTKPAINALLIFWKAFLFEPVKQQFNFFSSVQISCFIRPPDLSVQYCKFLI